MSGGGSSRPPAAAGEGRALTRIEDLVAHGLVPASASAQLKAVAERFQVRLTSHVVAAIGAGGGLDGGRGGEPDPIARQFVPDVAEAIIAPEELIDPIGDEVHAKVPGIVHRYPDRVLLKPTHLCQVYCRFCFRREVVGPEAGSLDDAELDAALGYIAGRPEIFEAILTGGDPLVLSDRRLGRILAGLEAIEHLGVIRIHSRALIADPGRATDDFVRLLRRRVAVWLVLHVNHPRELTPDVAAAIGRLVDGGVPLLAQTVLLKGVNDDAATLEALMRTLVRLRVKPYYLHHLDLAAGTSHFRVSVARGQELSAHLRGRVSGICQPTYVLDIPGGHGKAP
ncbi:MAG: lysine-2,3-aminomutase-like protein, partial [Ancalomicrobiaceae bacterium]|nr:lysine-2,3-aminomutase-like protein [Ancalomicrobiaceae bacterium]